MADAAKKKRATWAATTVHGEDGFPLKDEKGQDRYTKGPSRDATQFGRNSGRGHNLRAHKLPCGHHVLMLKHQKPYEGMWCRLCDIATRKKAEK